MPRMSRQKRWWPGPPPRYDPDGAYRDLVRVVLSQAVHDALGANEQYRDEALVFLHDAPAVAFWCELVGIEPSPAQVALLRAAGLEGAHE